MQVIDLIELHGGDVVKFAGDSMICAFVPTSSEKQDSKDEGKRLATLRCVRCATQLSTKYGALRRAYGWRRCEDEPRSIFVSPVTNWGASPRPGRYFGCWECSHVAKACINLCRQMNPSTQRASRK